MSKEEIEKKGVLGKAKGHKLLRNVFFPFTLHLPIIYTFVHLPTYGKMEWKEDVLLIYWVIAFCIPFPAFITFFFFDAYRLGNFH